MTLFIAGLFAGALLTLFVVAVVVAHHRSQPLDGDPWSSFDGDGGGGWR